MPNSKLSLLIELLSDILKENGLDVNVCFDGGSDLKLKGLSNGIQARLNFISLSDDNKGLPENIPWLHATS